MKEQEQQVIRAKVVDLIGSLVRWNGGQEFPTGMEGRVLDQRVPMRDWVIIYVDFGEYGRHWVSARRVVIA